MMAGLLTKRKKKTNRIEQLHEELRKNSRQKDVKHYLLKYVIVDESPR